MALMFPRLARNFVKNGYFPTDEPTLERALAALAPAGRGRALGALLVGAAGVTAGLIFALTRAPGEDPVAQCRASAGAA